MAGPKNCFTQRKVPGKYAILQHTGKHACFAASSQVDTYQNLLPPRFSKKVTCFTCSASLNRAQRDTSQKLDLWFDTSHCWTHEIPSGSLRRYNTGQTTQVMNATLPRGGLRCEADRRAQPTFVTSPYQWRN